MTDHARLVAPSEQDDLEGLLEYIAHDPALPSAHAAQIIVTYSRMIRIVSQLRRGQVELSAAHGMHVGDFDVLFVLQRAGARRLRATDLSALLRVTPGGISKRLDRLVTAGLVRRNAAKHDRRASVITLTQEGAILADSARSRSRIKTLNALDESEWRQLDGLLKRMAEAHARTEQVGPATTAPEMNVPQ
jgi:DNA-binding MarR family transcriptional regulator